MPDGNVWRQPMQARRSRKSRNSPLMLRCGMMESRPCFAGEVCYPERVIYAIRVTNGLTRYVKFGRARNPRHRLSSLQSGSPRYKLRLLGTGDWPDAEERRIHAYLYDHRVRGEWFIEGPATDHVVALLVDPDGLAKWHAQVLLPLPERLACVYSVCKSVDKSLTTAETAK